MSFHLITGLMGGGKSYLAVETCLQAAREGAIVHTNLPLVQEEWEALGLWDKIVILPKEPSKWIRFEKRIIDGEETEVPASDCITGGAEGRENIVVFDEASIVFRVKDQAKNKDKHQPVFDLIALSRHVGLEIIFIAQHEDNVSADLRRLAQHRTKCIKTAGIPLVGLFAQYLLGDFCRVVYQGQGRTPWLKSWHRFNLAIGKLYKTHGMAESVAMRVDATRTSKGMDQSKKKGLLVFVGGPLLCLFLLGVAGWRIKRDFFGGAKKPEATSKAAPDPNAGTDKGDTSKKPAPPAERGGLRQLEWASEDELILSGRVFTSSRMVVYARGGLRLGVGLDYEGSPIIEHVPYAGWHYFRTVAGRVVAVRPLRPQEREALPPVTVPGQLTAKEQEASPMTPITHGIDQAIDRIKGT
jgi:hypothetical protein